MPENVPQPDGDRWPSVSRTIDSYGWPTMPIASALIRSGPQRLRNVFSAIASAYFEGSLREMNPAAHTMAR